MRILQGNGRCSLKNGGRGCFPDTKTPLPCGKGALLFRNNDYS